MDTHNFNVVVSRRCELIKEVLAKKASEYARGDRLSNFKSAGRMMDETPEKALLYFRLKHEVSIADIVNDLDEGELPTVELLEEKIGDSINYLILLEALIKERILFSKEPISEEPCSSCLDYQSNYKCADHDVCKSGSHWKSRV